MKGTSNRLTDIVYEFASRYIVLNNSLGNGPTELHSMTLYMRKDIILLVRALTVLSPHVITMPDIKSAVRIYVVTTYNCFIYGIYLLYIFNAMLFNGTLPTNF